MSKEIIESAKKLIEAIKEGDPELVGNLALSLEREIEKQLLQSQ